MKRYHRYKLDSEKFEWLLSGNNIINLPQCNKYDFRQNDFILFEDWNVKTNTYTGHQILFKIEKVVILDGTLGLIIECAPHRRNALIVTEKNGKQRMGIMDFKDYKSLRTKGEQVLVKWNGEKLYRWRPVSEIKFYTVRNTIIMTPEFREIKPVLI